jgi:SynChlorMet cassette radical SAM/SPASM protein ScmE
VPYQDVPTTVWKRFFEELGECAVMDTTFQGGEPFLREDLRDLIESVVANRMRFSILSNGTQITGKMADFIAKTGRCDTVQVSIDGSTADTHDAFRGAGSFKAAVGGLQTLQKNGVPVSVRVTIHRRNVDDLEGIARLLLEDLGLPGFSTNSAGNLGVCRKNSSEILLTPVDRLKAMETLLRLSEQYENRISATAGPLAEARHWGAMEAARMKEDPAFSNGGHLTGCGCAWSKIAVRADGAYIPCSMLADLPLGNINQNSLIDVWQNSEHLEGLRKRGDISLERFDSCKDCPYLPYCTGNCPGLAYSLTGSVDHPSPDACLRLFLREGERLPSFRQH